MNFKIPKIRISLRLFRRIRIPNFKKPLTPKEWSEIIKTIAETDKKRAEIIVLYIKAGTASLLALGAFYFKFMRNKHPHKFRLKTDFKDRVIKGKFKLAQRHRFHSINPNNP